MKVELDLIVCDVFCSISATRCERMKLACLPCCQLGDFVTRFGDSLPHIFYGKKKKKKRRA